jgi:hypothetical protein
MDDMEQQAVGNLQDGFYEPFQLNAAAIKPIRKPREFILILYPRPRKGSVTWRVNATPKLHGDISSLVSRMSHTRRTMLAQRLRRHCRHYFHYLRILPFGFLLIAPG